MNNKPKYIMRNLFNLNFIYLILIAAEIAAIIFLCVLLPSFIPATATLAVVWIVSVAAAVFACCKGASPEISRSVILLVVALPIVGGIIYLISTFKKRERGLLKITGREALSGEEGMANALCGTGGAGYDRAVYFKSGDEYFSLLFKEIQGAKESVYLEYFIVTRGEIFNRLIGAIRAAVSNGATVKFMIDGIGSAFKLRRKDLKTLRSAGVEIKLFHRLKPLFYTGLNTRDHRKIVVIDGRVAFTGGFNVGDEYANISSPFGYWKDTGVAIYGNAAKVFEGMFLSVWNKGFEMELPEGGSERCIPYYDRPPHLSGVAENLFATAISSAQRRVHIFTPYFCAGERINDALRLAAMRGVDVRVIIPHIPDKRYAFELSRATAQKMMDSGIKFYEYTPGFMHAKSMVCDDRAFLGTHNFDFRSLRLNYECGAIFQGDICKAVERDFWESVKLSSPFTPPKRTPIRSFYTFFLKLFAPLF